VGTWVAVVKGDRDERGGDGDGDGDGQRVSSERYCQIQRPMTTIAGSGEFFRVDHHHWLIAVAVRLAGATAEWRT
jgi:hypothetical protein